jgi:predicted acyltransferase/poly(3-hydroxybutyrate) depolymerase
MSCATVALPHCGAGRYRSLDLLRGLAFCLWLLSGMSLSPLNECTFPHLQVLAHQLGPSQWHGLTIQDLVVPAFLFVAGASLVCSTQTRMLAGRPVFATLLHIAARSAIMFASGIVLGAMSLDYPSSRLCGPLQLIAVSVLAAGLLNLYCSTRVLLALAAALLANNALWLATLSPSGLHASQYGIRGSFAEYIDMMMLPGAAYFATWDPLGLWATFSSVFITLVGVLCARGLTAPAAVRTKALLLLTIAVCLTSSGMILATHVPINHYLWTAPFLLMSSGLLVGTLGVSWRLVDVCAAGWMLRPVEALGRNTFLLLAANSVWEATSIHNWLKASMTSVSGSWAPAAELSCRMVVIGLAAWGLSRHGVLFDGVSLARISASGSRTCVSIRRIAIPAYLACCSLMFVKASGSAVVDADGDVFFEPHVFHYRSPDGTQLDVPYRLGRPLAIDPGSRLPLLLFLHGAGAKGDDNLSQLQHLPRPLRHLGWYQRFPSVALVPQCDREHKWIDRVDPLLALLEHVEQNVPVDGERVYATGFSGGGRGVLALAVKDPTRFAAVVAVCCRVEERWAEKGTTAAVWCIEGAKDSVVPLEAVRRFAAAAGAAGGRARYTEMGGLTHNAWDEVYDNPDGIFPWMFLQRSRRTDKASSSHPQRPP